MLPTEASEDRSYDVCLSFAGAQRPFVEAVADRLCGLHLRVFYDRYEQADLWGRDLIPHLDMVYRRAARYCVLFASAEYASGLWTNRERASALARALQDSADYILLARFDDTEIPGIRPTIGYIDLGGMTPEQVAMMIAEKLGKPSARTIGGSERASSYVKSLLGDTSNDFLAIDDAICLSYGEASAELVRLPVGLTPNEIAAPVPTVPTSSQLVALLNGTSWDEGVINHLLRRLPDEQDHENNEWKLGVCKIVKAAPKHGQLLMLRLEPWLWWVEREFNRRLLRAPDHSSTRELARRLAVRLLTEDNDAGTYQFRFPSGLYVELAVVGEDEKLLLLAKESARGSHMAQAGMRWTCSIEEGAKLSDAANGTVDLARVARRGLGEELGINIDDVVEIQFGAVALQARHLNTAVLGVAKVSVAAHELARHAAAGRFRDFCDGEAISAKEARTLLDDHPEGRTSSWHATARLRLQLALAEISA